MTTPHDTDYYSDEYLRDHTHPRQAAVLLEVPYNARRAVSNRAQLLMNTTPGLIFSQALSRAAIDLKRVGLEGADNLAAMRTCSCGACSTDLARYIH
jgi:hypothetical protein